MAMTATDTRQTVARLRHLRTSPTKIRPVLSLITGQDVATARDTLRLSDRAVSHEVGKLLDSAVANAEHNDNIPEDELYVAHAYADEGPTLKRWRPRARGRGTRIRKRTTHLTIVVARLDESRLEELRRADAGSRGPRRVGRRRPRAEGVSEAEGTSAAGVSPDAETDAVEADEAAPAKKSARKSTKKTTKKAEPAKKAAKKSTKKAEPAKKTAKKSTAKKSTAKKTAKKATKKATKKRASDTSDEDQDS